MDKAYEIRVVMNGAWKLVACMASSQDAVDHAVTLQRDARYDAVRVTLRSSGDVTTPRLIYQFTRSGHQTGRAASGGIAGSRSSADDDLAHAESRRHGAKGAWKFWAGGALLLALGFEGCT